MWVARVFKKKKKRDQIALKLMSVRSIDDSINALHVWLKNKKKDVPVIRRRQCMGAMAKGRRFCFNIWRGEALYPEGLGVILQKFLERQKMNEAPQW